MTTSLIELTDIRLDDWERFGDSRRVYRDIKMTRYEEEKDIENLKFLIL